MTLLVTAVGKGFALSATDTRISIATGENYRPVEEYFNKSIVFRCAGFTGNISFTGIAEWTEGTEKVRMYDAVSESLTESILAELKIGQLAKKLGDDILRRLLSRKSYRAKREAVFEFHINGWHRDVPYGFLVVVSTFREKSPWINPNEFEKETHVDGLHLYFKSVDDFEFVVGGWDIAFYQKERQHLCEILRKGAGSFEVSQYISKVIETASTRHKSIGSRSVAVLLPQVGMLDTNAWDAAGSMVVGYMPKMIFENGTAWDPSEFPVNFHILLTGRLPRHSLFVKSIIAKQFKRADKRRIFKIRKGKFAPGIFGLLQLALFGSLPDDYDDLGLSDEEPEE
ncbi:hypothetical protein [Paraburkholderia sp. 32]|uniref:hypothetical protein n=1 Tax=Paraburkholderia sp. 32 TaxID=2991057 RepID=UPI003D19DC82